MTTQYFNAQGEELFPLPHTHAVVRISLDEFKKIKHACYANSYVGADTTALQTAYMLGQQNVLDKLRDGIVIEKP